MQESAMIRLQGGIRMNAFSKGITAVNVKLSRSLEEAKINTYIDTLNQEVNSLKIEIGNMIYARWRSGGTIEIGDDIIVKLDMIRQRMEEISAKNKEIEQMQEDERRILGGAINVNTMYCTNCGAANSAANSFCEQCGSQLVK